MHEFFNFELDREQWMSDAERLTYAVFSLHELVYTSY